MKDRHTDRLILAIEAVLITLSLASGGKALVGMACYWTLVAVYHLTEYMTGRREDGR